MLLASNDPRYWIGFQLTPNMGPVRTRLLVDHFGSPEAAWRAPEAALRATGLSSDLCNAIVHTRKSVDLDREIEKLDRHGVRAIAVDCDDYPRLLRHIPAQPTVLYMKGTIEPIDDLSIGIVGTRRSTTYGVDMTRQIAGDLAAAGVTIVSGLARGIDTVSHDAALSAGGRTIAVCGCGLDTIYPPQNRRLAERIIGSGALISEYPIGIPPDGPHFPARNRIISGLSRGVLVIEAPRRSGALITTNFALDQGRDVYAVPGSALSRQSEGCHELIRAGATLVTNAEHILEDLNVTASQSAVQSRMLLPETEAEKKLFACIGAEPRHINELSMDTDLPVHEASGTLLTMELKGLIRQSGAQHYVRS
jgi:DNA processing protein